MCVWIRSTKQMSDDTSDPHDTESAKICYIREKRTVFIASLNETRLWQTS